MSIHAGIYLTIVMALTSVSVIMTVFVLNLHYRGPHSDVVPRWLRRLMGLNNQVQQGLSFRRGAASAIDSADDSFQFLVDGYFSDTPQCQCVQNVSLKITMENLAKELKQELDNGNGATDDANRMPVPDVPRVAEGRPSSSRVGPTSSIQRQVAFSNQEILRALQKVVERYELDDNEGAVIYEWRQMAVAVDRILFWVFLVGTLASTFIILGIVPLTKDL